jgi:hypothetical protein
MHSPDTGGSRGSGVSAVQARPRSSSQESEQNCSILPGTAEVLDDRADAELVAAGGV